MKRHNVLYGGRGSGKSTAVALYLAWIAQAQKKRILAGREFQNSIAESSRAAIVGAIEKLGLGSRYEIKQGSITSATGSEFIFAGLRHNVDSIRSMEGLDIVWLEEAANISRSSMKALVPSVRAPGSKLIYTINPRMDTDPVYHDFIEPSECPVNVNRMSINFVDNPWFKNTELVGDMEHARDTDPSLYRHVWLGELLQDDDARILKNVTVSKFEAPEGSEFVAGVDFGFSISPTIAIRSFMSEDQKTIFVDHEAFGNGVGTDDLADLLDTIPNIKDIRVVGDSSRPETIDHLVKHGFSVYPSKKGAGSVKDGISFLQSKKLVFHPRCLRMIEEAGMYKWKRHAQTDMLTPVPVKEFDDGIDALRYAWQDMWMTTAGFHIDMV